MLSFWKGIPSGSVSLKMMRPTVVSNMKPRVDPFRVAPGLRQVPVQPVGAALCSGEDQRSLHVHRIQQFQQQRLLLVRRYAVHHLIDRRHGGAGREACNTRESARCGFASGLRPKALR